MRLGLGVAFEAVFVAALFGADLAVPPETLEAFGFHLVGEVFCGTDFGAGHSCGCWGGGKGRGSAEVGLEVRVVVVMKLWAVVDGGGAWVWC